MLLQRSHYFALVHFYLAANKEKVKYAHYAEKPAKSQRVVYATHMTILYNGCQKFAH